MASALLLPLSIGGSDSIWPDGSYGDSDGDSDDGDSDDGDSDDGSCRGGALPELVREDAVELGDKDLWFSVARGRQDNNKGPDVLLLTDAMIPWDEDDNNGSGEEDEGKKTSGGERTTKKKRGGGGLAPLGVCVVVEDRDNRGGGGCPRWPSRGAPTRAGRRCRGGHGPQLGGVDCLVLIPLGLLLPLPQLLPLPSSRDGLSLP